MRLGMCCATFIMAFSQFQLSYFYGLRTEKLLGAATHDRIYTIILMRLQYPEKL